MRNLILIGGLGCLMIWTSCGGDKEPTIPPIVGEWELDDAIYSGATGDFDYINGSYNDVFNEDSYVLKFYDDFTFEREILGSSYGDLEDDGDWELDGDNLDLDPKDEIPILGNSASFKVAEEITAKDLVLTYSDQILSFPIQILQDPQALDTITTQEQYNKLIDDWAQLVDIDIRLEFDKN